MSDDLISRQALLDKLNEWDWQELYLPSHFKELIVDEVPSVQPKQKIGLWVHNQSKYTNRWICTECDYTWFFQKEEAKYCPNCGAKMEA